MAEAIRAYMTDPNYLKSVAPETAKRIREAVNANPRLNSVIQLNANPATGTSFTLVPIEGNPFDVQGEGISTGAMVGANASIGSSVLPYDSSQLYSRSNPGGLI